MEIPLYQTVPGAIRDVHVTETKPYKGEVGDVTIPTLTIFLPQKQNPGKAAVLIFPGGGYSHLAMEKEGFDVAKKFNEKGITAFVLKYRMPLSSSFTNPSFLPLQDAEQAIAIVRNRAAEWGYSQDNIGVIGFSAGGHLAATLMTHYDNCLLENNTANLRPDWVMLGYPVISMSTELGHTGSRKYLLGKDPSPEKIDYFSLQLHVNSHTPTSFLFLAEDDDVVNPKNGIIFYEALLQNKISAELHIYPKGGHGFGLNNKTTKESWFDNAILWLESSGFYQ